LKSSASNAPGALSDTAKPVTSGLFFDTAGQPWDGNAPGALSDTAKPVTSGLFFDTAGQPWDGECLAADTSLEFTLDL
jgi:hypothetical protein